MGNKDTGTFLVGFLLGGIAGAATVIFLAPQSGEETREQIRKRGIEMQKRAEKTLADAQSMIEEVVTDIQDRTQTLQTQSRVVLEEGQQQLSQAIKETKAAAAATPES